jgi:hypothetical protein
MSQVFFSIAIWLSQRRATLTLALTAVGSVAEIRFLEAQVRSRQLKREAGALDPAFPSARLIFCIDHSLYLEIAAGRGLPAPPLRRER